MVSLRSKGGKLASPATGEIKTIEEQQAEFISETLGPGENFDRQFNEPHDAIAVVDGPGGTFPPFGWAVIPADAEIENNGDGTHTVRASGVEEFGFLFTADPANGGNLIDVISYGAVPST